MPFTYKILILSFLLLCFLLTRHILSSRPTKLLSVWLHIIPVLYLTEKICFTAQLVAAFSNGRENEIFYASLYAGLYSESEVCYQLLKTVLVIVGFSISAVSGIFNIHKKIKWGSCRTPGRNGNHCLSDITMLHRQTHNK